MNYTKRIISMDQNLKREKNEIQSDCKYISIYAYNAYKYISILKYFKNKTIFFRNSTFLTLLNNS